MLPYNDYFEYYGPDYRLHMPTSNMENMNKRETLEEVSVVYVYYYPMETSSANSWHTNSEAMHNKW